MNFFGDLAQIQAQIEQIKPLAYIRNRNFLDGDVTRLSPYITHGIIDTWELAQAALARYPFDKIEKFIFQLAWREFFHNVWQAKGEAIFSDLKYPQAQVVSRQLPTAVLTAQTGVRVLDETLEQLYATGYIHNHARMWCAALVSNMAKTDWLNGARWMYYHLLDGDLASNMISWQWVAGTFRNRPYLANQDNLNKYSRSQQRDTFLDVTYAELAELPVPDVLTARQPLELPQSFPEADEVATPEPGSTVFLYHPHSLDPAWHQGESGRRILLIEPSSYEDFPLSPQRWRFVTHWARQIPDMEIFVGSFADLFPQGSAALDVRFKEYPLQRHWQGKQEGRRWLAPEVQGYFPSFFSFWNKAKKHIRKQNP